MATVEGAGVELAYDDGPSPEPDAPAVLLVHGMAADRAVWARVARALAGDARVLALDRRGYGGSGAPDPYEATTVAEQAEDLVALLGAAGARGAVAAGCDIGALAVLDVLLRHPGALRGAVLVDVPALALVPDANEPLAAERAGLEDALRAGGPAAAVRAWLAAHGARDAERLERACRDAAAFFADYGGQATLALSRRALRAVRAPVVVIDTAGAPPHVRAAGDALARLLPGARRGGEEDVAAAVRGMLAP